MATNDSAQLHSFSQVEKTDPLVESLGEQLMPWQCGDSGRIDAPKHMCNPLN